MKTEDSMPTLITRKSERKFVVEALEIDVGFNSMSLARKTRFKQNSKA